MEKGAARGILFGVLRHFGEIRALRKNYRSKLLRAHPEVGESVNVHHSVEQQVLSRYPGRFTEEEIDSLENLRGIPNNLNNELHLRTIRIEWNSFYRAYSQATREQILQKAAEIDAKYGSQFTPPGGVQINRYEILSN